MALCQGWSSPCFGYLDDHMHLQSCHHNPSVVPIRAEPPRPDYRRIYLRSYNNRISRSNHFLCEGLEIATHVDHSNSSLADTRVDACALVDHSHRLVRLESISI